MAGRHTNLKKILSVLLIFCGFFFSVFTGCGVCQAQNNETKIVLLGTGTPNAEPDRFGSAVAIVVNDTPYLIDCGSGIVRRANAACQSGVEALKVNKLCRLFITHLHSDHTTGYADLILTPWVLEREEPLQVYGPVGIKNMTNCIHAAYAEDIRVRLEGLEPINSEGYKNFKDKCGNSAFPFKFTFRTK